MFQLFNPDSNLPFMRWGRITVILSSLLILAAFVLLFRPGLNFGLDFTGGSLVELHFDDPADLAEVRGKLADAGYPDAVVQTFGSSRDIVVRLAPREGRAEAEDLGREVQAELANAGLPSELKRNEFVGPQVGRELAEDGVVAIVVVIIGILIYIAARFEWRFAIAAIAGQVHDTMLTVGFLVLIGMEIDLTVLAALLAVVGYSINDKIVVFDRIRENFRVSRRMSPEEVVNSSVNTTLSRTVITSLLTLLAVSALYFAGGPALEGFSLTLIAGIIIGTYSSILFASPILVKLGVTKQDLMPKVRDESELARRP
ncbi:MAG TPA: protein translocase subunit SecF [Xanthomonadaceae bacterium]|nr:protein translocase subunit SecF [Xanthomonadaceae bacterium]